MSKVSRYSPEVQRKLEMALNKEQASFVRFMDDYIERKRLVRKDIALKADIGERQCLNLLNGTKHTNKRDQIIKICIAMGMNQREADRALYLYEFAELGNQPRDEVIIIGLSEHMDLDDIDELLRYSDMEPLISD